MGLRTDKEMVPNVVANAATHIHKEVVRADEIVAGETVGAIGKIVACALPSNAGHQVSAHFLAEPRLIQRVEVAEDWTIRLSGIRSLARPPRSLESEADSLMENNVGSDVVVQTALLGTKQKAAAVAAVTRPR